MQEGSRWLCLYVDLNGMGQALPPTIFFSAMLRKQETLSPVSFYAVQALSLSYLHADRRFSTSSRAMDPSWPLLGDSSNDLPVISVQRRAKTNLSSRIL